jgi:hypothetical protein
MENEFLRIEDWMEVSDNGLWIVDELIEDPHYIRCSFAGVGNSYYKIIGHKAELVPNYKPCFNYYRAEYNHEFFIRGVEPRGGFKKLEVGRAVTDDEFDELKDLFGLAEDDISDEFEQELGATFGPKATVKVTVRQIQLPNDKAVSLEAELRDIGIYAGNGSAGHLNIRIK